MSNTVLDKKSESHSYGLGAETVETTMWLIYLGNNKVGLNYESKWSGIKSGHIKSDKPLNVTKNGSYDVNNSPKVTVTIAEFNNSGGTAAMRVKIVVDTGIWVVGEQTIYNKHLKGSYQDNTGWKQAFQELEANESV